MFCKFCGKNIDDNSLYCSLCGNALAENSDNQSTPNEQENVGLHVHHDYSKEQLIDGYIIRNIKYISMHSRNSIKSQLMDFSINELNAIQYLPLVNPTTMTLFAIFLFPLGLDRFMTGKIGIGVMRIVLCLISLFIPMSLLFMLGWLLYESISATKRTYDYNASIIIGKKHINLTYKNYSHGYNPSSINEPQKIVSIISSVLLLILLFTPWFKIRLIGEFSFISLISDYMKIQSVINDYIDSRYLETITAIMVLLLMYGAICVLVIIVYLFDSLYHYGTKKAKKFPSSYPLSISIGVFSIAIMIIVWAINYAAQNIAHETLDLFGADELFGGYVSRIIVVSLTSAPVFVLLICIIMFILQISMNVNTKNLRKWLDETSEDRGSALHGLELLKEKSFDSALYTFDEALVFDNHDAMAWWGKLLVRLKCSGFNELVNQDVDFTQFIEYKNALRYADNNEYNMFVLAAERYRERNKNTVDIN
jgi:TM2 domain-containing membrane protein YozV